MRLLNLIGLGLFVLVYMQFTENLVSPLTYVVGSFIQLLAS